MRKLQSSLMTMCSLMALKCGMQSYASDLMDEDAQSTASSSSYSSSFSSFKSRDQELQGRLLERFSAEVNRLVPNESTSAPAATFLDNIVNLAVNAALDSAEDENLMSSVWADHMETMDEETLRQLIAAIPEQNLPQSDEADGDVDEEDAPGDASSEVGGANNEAQDQPLPPSPGREGAFGAQVDAGDSDSTLAILLGALRRLEESMRVGVLAFCGQHFGEFEDFDSALAALRLSATLEQDLVIKCVYLLKAELALDLKPDDLLRAVSGLVVLSPEEQTQLIDYTQDLFSGIPKSKRMEVRVETLLTLRDLAPTDRAPLVAMAKQLLVPQAGASDIYSVVESMVDIPVHLWQNCLDLLRPYLSSGLSQDQIIYLFEGFHNVNPDLYAATEGQEDALVEFLSNASNYRVTEGHKRHKLRDVDERADLRPLLRMYLCDIPASLRPKAIQEIQTFGRIGCDGDEVVSLLGKFAYFTGPEDMEVLGMLRQLYAPYFEGKTPSTPSPAHDSPKASEPQQADYQSPFEDMDLGDEDSDSEDEGLISFGGIDMPLLDLVIDTIDDLMMVPPGEARQKMVELHQKAMQDSEFDLGTHTEFWSYLMATEPQLAPKIRRYWLECMGSPSLALRHLIADKHLAHLMSGGEIQDYSLTLKIIETMAKQPFYHTKDAEFYLHYELMQKRAAPIDWSQLQVPSVHFDEQGQESWEVRLNPQFLTHLVDDDQLGGVREELVPPCPGDFFEAMSTGLQTRADVVPGFLDAVRQATSQDLQTLIVGSLGSSYLTHLLNVPAEMGRLPLRTAKLRAIVASIMAAPDDTAYGHVLSPREEQFVKMLASIQLCTTGKNNGIEMFYQALDFRFKLQIGGVNTATNPLRTFVAEIAQRQVEKQFSGDNALFLEAAGLWDVSELQEPLHQALYLKNLIGRDVGLLHTPTFDQYILRVVHPRLRNIGKQEAISLFYKHFSAVDLVEAVQREMNLRLERKDPDMTYLAIQDQLLPWCQKMAHEGGGDRDLEEVIYEWHNRLWQVEGASIRLTSLGAAVLLRSLNALDLVKERQSVLSNLTQAFCSVA
ncbi:MAG: hypothetical protein ACK5O7_03495 [Holosporales bacterium]